MKAIILKPEFVMKQEDIDFLESLPGNSLSRKLTKKPGVDNAQRRKREKVNEVKTKWLSEQPVIVQQTLSKYV